MSDLKDRLIRLGSTNPELREHIRPVLAELDAEAASKATFKCPDCDTKVLEATSYCLKCEKKVKKAGVRTASIIEHSGPYLEAVAQEIGRALPGQWRLGRTYAGRFAVTGLLGTMDVPAFTETKEVDVMVKVQLSRNSGLTAAWQADLSGGWTDIADLSPKADIFDDNAAKSLATQLMKIWKGQALPYLLDLYGG